MQKRQLVYDAAMKNGYIPAPYVLEDGDNINDFYLDPDNADKVRGDNFEGAKAAAMGAGAIPPDTQEQFRRQVAGLFEAKGYTVADTPEEADYDKDQYIDPAILAKVKGGSYAYCDEDGNYYRAGMDKR